MWGGVGRGKTWLMDLFFQSLPFRDKQRSHFHRFMQSVHDELKKHKEQANPLDRVADRLAQKARVLCFDELFVTDIADAMLLGNLFRGLFERGVTLVATSNVAPDDLYKEGLQRARFLPAIRQLKEHTQVVHMDGGADYRLRLLERAHTWFDARDAATRRAAGKTIRRDCGRARRDRHHADSQPSPSARASSRRRSNLVLVQGAVRRPARPGRLHRDRALLSHGVLDATFPCSGRTRRMPRAVSSRWSTSSTIAR